ncbi:MAG: sugar ABC transporter permease [Clostridia bacterium]|nr:sugar ABC transporter permease [Clostridia bacterium]
MSVLKTNKNRIKNSGILFYSLMILIPSVQFCIFYIGVNFNSILLAFKDYDAITGKYSWIGFANFERFIIDLSAGNALAYAIKNSLIAYFVGLIVGTVLTLFFSYYIFKKKFLYNAYRIILFLPSMLSAMVMTIIFGFLSGNVFPAIGLKDYLAEMSTQFGAILFFNIWVGFGTGVLLYSNSMSQVSQDVIEAGQIDGVNSLQEFFYIIMPGIFPTLSTFLITGVAGIFINQVNIFSFFADAADIHIYTIGYYLFTKVVGGSASIATYPYAAAAGLLLTAVAVPITYGMKFALEKFGPSED